MKNKNFYIKKREKLKESQNTNDKLGKIISNSGNRQRDR